ncbi:MAG: DegT/DnrJ/EryC1/StrS family aminotransferase [Phycisphaerae bacterium]
MRPVGMLDLRAEHERIAGALRAAIDDVLASQAFINGPAVAALEDDVSSRVGVRHAVAVSSGTDALLCTLMALGIGPGDEVIVPTFTFFATAGCVARVGAKPVFVDIDARTFNIDPDRVEAAITDRTRAIIAVHLFGQCAEMDAIRRVADRRDLPVIEDAAQAIDARYDGRQACALGHVACVSFYPTKNLAGIGEGGMILTDDADLADLARQLRQHGESDRYIHARVGGNFRLDTLKAAVLRVKLGQLDELTARRQHNANAYSKRLAGTPVTTPYVGDRQVCVFHQYSILCDRRDELRAYLADRKVASGVYYPKPLHLQPCFAALGYGVGDMPAAERTCARILSLPCHPMLTDTDIEYVVSCVKDFYAGHARR